MRFDEPRRTECPDEMLCALAAGGDRVAEETLVIRYNRLVRVCARPYFLAGGDSEDLIQEGMMGLLAAVRERQEATLVQAAPGQEVVPGEMLRTKQPVRSRKRSWPLILTFCRSWARC